MKTFLESVAQDLLNKYGEDMARLAIVFPNKRAGLFLNQALANLSDSPIWSPNYITISELFRQHSRLTIGDSIKLITDLHLSYTSITGKVESIDTFYNWGQLLLADFDDIDKNMADAEKVFRNLRDYHEFDDISYLTEEQKAIVQRFFSHFTDHESTIQKRFLELWSKLYDIYTDYRQRLLSQGIAYEGMLYRDVVEGQSPVFEFDKYLFVGFNMTQQVEQQLFRKLKKEGKAAFYWDFDHYYMDPSVVGNSAHEAGVYIRQNFQQFPNELPTDDDTIYNNLADRSKNITFISAATENIQSRYVSEWLRQDQRFLKGNRIAVVMCNENLLPTIIHCIPDEVESVNVTTGYPLQGTPIASFVVQVATLLAPRYPHPSSRSASYTLREVNTILHHPYAPFLSPQSVTLLEKLNAAKRFFLSASELTLDEGLTLLFGNNSATPTPSHSLPGRLRDLTKFIAQHGQTDNDPLFQESTFRMYTLLNRLAELVASGDLQTDNITLMRLIRQLIGSTSVPFHGEPAVGIQVMGVLETRNLDFDHVLILSCNEGFMPKGVNDNSFIPYALRKAYGLTTIDNKVAIYSYYFHRLIQRASTVTVLYNKSTEGVSTGEASRFMLQLLVELPTPIRREALQSPLSAHILSSTTLSLSQSLQAPTQSLSFEKLSPTAINRYIRCGLQFYYRYLAGIPEPNETEDGAVDNRIFGNIFHRAAQLTYETLLPRQLINRDDIDRLLRNPNSLSSVMEQAISEELFHLPEGTCKHPPLNGLQLISTEVIETYLRQMLRVDITQTPFTVLAHEYPLFQSRYINGKEIMVGGRADRIDLVDGTLRVVDYKTGNREAKGLKTPEEIFDASKIHTHHSDYILQAMLYASNLTDSKIQKNLLRGSNTVAPGSLPVAPALLFVQHAIADNYSPLLTIDGNQITDIANQLREPFEKILCEKVEEIVNPEIPFTPTKDRRTCETCPYHTLCGR